MVFFGNNSTEKRPWELTNIATVNWAVIFYVDINGISIDFFSLPSEYQKHILNCIAQGESEMQFEIKNN